MLPSSYLVLPGARQWPLPRRGGCESFGASVRFSAKVRPNENFCLGAFLPFTPSAQDALQSVTQIGFLAEPGQLEEALADRLVGHVLLAGQPVRLAVRVVVADPVPKRALPGMPGVAQVHRDLGRAVLADPPAGALDRLVRRVR